MPSLIEILGWELHGTVIKRMPSPLANNSSARCVNLTTFVGVIPALVPGTRKWQGVPRRRIISFGRVDVDAPVHTNRVQWHIRSEVVELPLVDGHTPHIGCAGQNTIHVVIPSANKRKRVVTTH